MYATDQAIAVLRMLGDGADADDIKNLVNASTRIEHLARDRSDALDSPIQLGTGIHVPRCGHQLRKSVYEYAPSGGRFDPHMRGYSLMLFERSGKQCTTRQICTVTGVAFVLSVGLDLHSLRFSPL